MAQILSEKPPGLRGPKEMGSIWWWSTLASLKTRHKVKMMEASLSCIGVTDFTPNCNLRGPEPCSLSSCM